MGTHPVVHFELGARDLGARVDHARQGEHQLTPWG